MAEPNVEHGQGRLAGYQTWPGWDPYEDTIGPMYFKNDGTTVLCAMEIESRHCNTGGICHGGLLMAFADFSSFAIARAHLGGPSAATVSMNSDFCAPVVPGDLLQADGTVLRETGSMLFAHVRLFVADTTVMSASAVVKKQRRAS